MGLFARIKALLYALLNQSVVPGPNIFREALAHFRAPEYGLEKELQELVAIREATDPRYASSEKAGALEHRLQEIVALLGTASR